MPADTATFDDRARSRTEEPKERATASRRGVVHEIDRGYHAGFARAFGLFIHAVNRVWFRFELRHPERLPVRPCLIVGNHSGIGIVDVLTLVGGWTAHFGGARRGVGMMHKMFITAPVVGRIARAFGAVPADPASARSAVVRGLDVVTYPGGDIDACRPFYEARTVQFGRRRGYVRLALDLGVPIAPLATIGSHATYTMLPWGTTIARALGMKRWARTERFPVVLGTVLSVTVLELAIAGLLPWWSLALALFATVIPNPVRVTTEVLPAIDVAGQTAHITDPEARVEAAHELVREALSRAVATMQHGERAGSSGSGTRIDSARSSS